MSVASPVFLSTTNLINISGRRFEIGIMAVGMTMLIIAGTGSVNRIIVCIHSHDRSRVV